MTVEPEFYRMAPPNVAIHSARMMYDPTFISRESLAKLEFQIEKAVEEVLWTRPNVICFACTSGSLVIGDKRIVEKIHQKSPNVPATTTITAVLESFRELDIRKVSIGTPYTDDVNEEEKDYLEERGVSVVEIEGLQIREGPMLSLQEQDTIYALAKKVDRPEAQAVFLSCTGLHAIPLIEKLEAELKKPVISSNQASFWHSCKLAGIRGPIAGYGRLLNAL